MRAIERAAGELFRGIGMDAVADDEPAEPGRAAGEIAPDLRAIRQAENAQGLDRWPCGGMRRDPATTLTP